MILRWYHAAHVTYDAPIVITSEENDILIILRFCAADLMWEDHAEVSKQLLTRAADEIERLRSKQK